jgi:hypothetical protein
VRLRAGDIDSEQMIIRIVQSKGRKDRHVMLPAEVLDLLRQWWKVRPSRHDAGIAPEQRWLFPGRSEYLPLTTRQFGRLFKEAAKAAGLRKMLSLHASPTDFIPALARPCASGGGLSAAVLSSSDGTRRRSYSPRLRPTGPPGPRRGQRADFAFAGPKHAAHAGRPWSAADWAIRFYQRHGFALVSPMRKSLLLTERLDSNRRTILFGQLLHRPIDGDWRMPKHMTRRILPRGVLFGGLIIRCSRAKDLSCYIGSPRSHSPLHC